MSYTIAMLLKPFVFFVLLACVLLPCRFAVIKWMPEGKVKRILLFRVKSEW